MYVACKKLRSPVARAPLADGTSSTCRWHELTSPSLPPHGDNGGWVLKNSNQSRPFACDACPVPFRDIPAREGHSQLARPHCVWWPHKPPIAWSSVHKYIAGKQQVTPFLSLPPVVGGAAEAFDHVGDSGRQSLSFTAHVTGGAARRGSIRRTERIRVSAPQCGLAGESGSY